MRFLLIPMLKEIEKRQFKGEVCLFYSNKTLSSSAFQTELANLKIANYKYRPIITSVDKRIDAALLKTYLRDLQSQHYYLVGTSAFLTTMKELLKGAGVDQAKITIDDFG